MHPFSYVPAQDPLFGVVEVELDHEGGSLVVVVDGEEIVRVEVRRAAGAAVESHVPIGTRDPDRLSMTVGGAEVALRPAKGFLTRRSYRVDVGEYRLVPDSLDGSRLLRDGAVLGVFSSSGDGRVSVEWKGEPGADDAAVGYALAAAFGTGAEPMWKLTLDALLELWP
ncbi:hypothetical protein ACFWA6_19365 [Streptomyces sp. NPDC060020]|uniref:hypothetical protein n=1 Tax=Streptomyces sp. NPDC060020 TaxID=3347038 RepID=UPI0036B600D6